MSVRIWGVGTSLFGKQPDKSAEALVRQSVLEAMQDAGVTEVDAVFAATVFDGPGTVQRSLQTAGVFGVPIVTIENACASGTTAFHEAVESVRLGRYRSVLVVGVETMSARFDGSIIPEQADREGRQGMAMPAIYGMAAARYMSEFHVTAEQLASVSVKNHRHGFENPRAQRRRLVTLEEVMGARMISDPLTVLQCCAIADGSAAAIVGGERSVAGDVRVRASALRSGNLWDHRARKVWGWDLVNETSRLAFEAAGIAVDDVDLFEVHDAFTIGEIMTVEALGLAPIGDGARVSMAGVTSIGGRSPVNPSGGLLSRGHPLGATGLAQIAEVVWQLRGQAGSRQIENARLGVVETMGGGTAGIDGNGCVVAVLESGTARS